jgi:hypothetical protein
MNAAGLIRWKEVPFSLRSDALAACFVSAVSALAQITGIALLLFPELAALSFDIFRRPHGAWAKAPVLLVATPFLTGIVGTVVARNLQFGPLSVLIIVFTAILIVRVMRSPIVPAVAAGLLPLIIGEMSWWYAPSLLIGTSILAGVSVLRARLYPISDDVANSVSSPKPESLRSERDLSWIPFFTAFLVISASAAVWTGERLLLLPPLVVVALELFAHFDTCPWVKRPLVIPVVCGLSALSTVIIVGWLGTGPLAVFLAMIAVATIVRLFNFHFPPAIAIGILPFIMPHFDTRYPAVVTVAAIFLIGVFFLWRSMASRWQKRFQRGA